MCGRFSQTFTWDDLLEFFHLVGSPLPIAPRYNVAPSQEVAAVRVAEGERRLVLLRWGLVPFWSRDPRIGYRMINARAETVHQAPAFRAAFRGRRCLIPAGGFYEWDKKGESRQPFYIRRADGQPLALAGLWERWEQKEGAEIIESCTILTTVAEGEVAKLHERMPVILEPEDFGLWLDPDEHGVERLRDLLQPAAPGVLNIFPVSTFVNKATNEGEKCIEPTEGAGE